MSAPREERELFKSHIARTRHTSSSHDPFESMVNGSIALESPGSRKHDIFPSGDDKRVDEDASSLAEKFALSGFVQYHPKPPGNGPDESMVDMIAVPAVGAHPERTWQPKVKCQQQLDPREIAESPISSQYGIAGGVMSTPTSTYEWGRPWIFYELQKVIPCARVMLYNHGNLDEESDLDSLSTQLLEHIMTERIGKKHNRPLFFVCHSTGGLVAKAALIKTQSESKYTSIKYHSYGLTFFATPHQGSSFLSSTAFDDSIKEAMNLIYSPSKLLQQQLQVNHPKLEELSVSFNRVAAELKLFTFYETIDTIMSPKVNENNVVTFSAPIVSIKSALLHIHHEVERPLLGNHADCAAFGGDNDYARWSYLEKLSRAVRKSIELCNKDHIELNLKNEAHVEIHGFYEAGDGPAQNPLHKAPIRLWSTKDSLQNFLVKGPSECLQELLQVTARNPESGRTKTSRKVTNKLNTSGDRRGHDASTWRDPSISASPSPNPIQYQQNSSDEIASLISRGSKETSLTTPNVSNQKLTWVHLPFNNPTWCSDILKLLAAEKNSDSYLKLLDPKNWSKKHIWGRHTEYHACFMKPGCNLVAPEPESLMDLPESGPLGPLPVDVQMSLFFPYLHWDTYKRMVRRRDIVKERIAQGRSRPTPSKVANMDLEHRVTWRYLSYDPPFNTRRTLDQYGYPNLLDTRARDDDQMLYKMTKVDSYKPEIGSRTDNNFEDENKMPASEKRVVPKNSNEGRYEHLRDGKVLMVDQVWLWIVDNSTTVTFFPKREPIKIEGRLYQQADLRNSIYNEVNGDLSRRCENSLDLSALVALHAVTLLFERSSHRDLEVFRVFEESISILVEKMTKSFKYFRAKGFRATADDEDMAEDANSMKTRHKREGQQFQEQIRDNVSALLELRDIGDELQTLKKLFEQQKESLEHMLHYYQRCGHGKTNGCSFLHEAQVKLKDYLHQIQQMMDSADRTKNDFEKLLDLVQRQANVDEARLSRWQADVQGIQSRAVMIFTVFTIIFLPLTFFTGLFGMNAREWSDVPSNVPIGTIASISIPISFFITLSALGFALSTRVRRILSFSFHFIFHPYEDRNGQGRRKWRRTRDRKREDYDETDFWIEHRGKDDAKYEIPVHNRWPTTMESEGKFTAGGLAKRKSSRY